VRDPVIRLRKYLESKNLWNDDLQKKSEEKAKAITNEVVKRAENIEKPTLADIFDFTYATLPPELEIQKRTMRTSSLGQDPEQSGLKAEPQHA
jgi:pyruvate dehydrogenase E1 component alpha subunit